MHKPIPRRSIVKTMAVSLLSAPALIAHRAFGAEPMRVPNYVEEIRAYLRSDLTQEEIDTCEESARILLAQNELFHTIEARLLEESMGWEGAAAARDEDWFGFFVDAADAGVLRGHPFARRFAMAGLDRLEHAGFFGQFEQASRAARFPHWHAVDSWFGADGVVGEYLGMSRVLSRAGRLRCIVAAEEGDAETIERTLHAMIRLARMSGHERGFLIDRLVCTSNTVRAIDVIRDLVQKKRATPDLLKAFAQVLAAISPPPRNGFFEGERLFMLASTQRDAAEHGSEYMIFWPTFLETVNALFAELNRLHQLPYARRPPFSSAAFLKRRQHWWNPLDLGFDDYVELKFSLAAIDRLEREVGGTRLVVAIESYRAARGRLPDSLDALVPDYLGALPVDPFATDGRFLFHLIDPARNAQGRDYVVCSGRNEPYDGEVSTERETWGEARDIVLNTAG